MNITYRKAKQEDIEVIYRFSDELIRNYEALETIDYTGVMHWVRAKIEKSINEYTVVSVNDLKAGYYHFYK